MVDVYASVFTPGVRARDTRMQPGYKIRYRNLSGTEEDGIVDSVRMVHTSGCYGYECLFDHGDRGFADADRIVSFEVVRK